MLWNALNLAQREIRRNVLRSSLTTLGIIIGVSAVIIMVTLGNGATDGDAGLKIRTMRLPDAFQEHDAPDRQYDEARLNAPHIVETVLSALRHNSAGVEEARA